MVEAVTPLRIAVSGASGLVGSRLCPWLRSAGHEVVTIVRRPSDDPRAVAVWESEREAARLDGIDAVIHLAGKPVAAKRWSESIKREIRDSRVQNTAVLCDRLARLSQPPKTLLSASGVGIYGDCGEALLTEDSARCSGGFMTKVAEQWEEACDPAREAGIRVTSMRFGIILSAAGGALPRMLLPARLGGGRLGSGKQWWSWIAIDDVLGGIGHLLATASVDGPVNFTAPAPVRNCEFAATLGRILRRPALLPAPAFAMRLLIGEMAEMLLESARVHPEKLLASGYEFRFPQLDDALRHLLGKPAVPSAARR